MVMEEKETIQEKTKTKKPEKKIKKKKKAEITVKANKKGRHVMPLLNFIKAIVVPFYWLVKPFKLYGNKKVQDGPLIYVCNHYTLMDAVYPAVTTSEGIHYLAKKENFETPGLGFLIRKVKGIAANRDGNDVRAILDCFKCLKNGEKLCIFPEGTRNKTGEEMLPFHHGAAAIAIKCKVPIVFVLIYKKPRYFRKTHIIVSEPIELTEYYGKKLTDEELTAVDERLRLRMIEMRREHTEFLQSKKKKKTK